MAVHISQLNLVVAIVKELERQGVKSFSAGQLNVMSKCVDEIIMSVGASPVFVAKVPNDPSIHDVTPDTRTF